MIRFEDLTTSEALRAFLAIPENLALLPTLKEEGNTLLMYLAANLHFNTVAEYLQLVPVNIIKSMAMAQNPSSETEGISIFRYCNHEVQLAYIAQCGESLKNTASLQEGEEGLTAAMIIFRRGSEAVQLAYIAQRGKSLEDTAALQDMRGRAELMFILWYGSEAAQLAYVAKLGWRLNLIISQLNLTLQKFTHYPTVIAAYSKCIAEYKKMTSELSQELETILTRLLCVSKNTPLVKSAKILSMIDLLKYFAKSFFQEAQKEGNDYFAVDLFERLPTYYAFCHDTQLNGEKPETMQQYLSELIALLTQIDDPIRLYRTYREIASRVKQTPDETTTKTIAGLAAPTGDAAEPVCALSKAEQRIYKYHGYNILALKYDGEEISTMLPSQKAAISRRLTKQRVVDEVDATWSGKDETRSYSIQLNQLGVVINTQIDVPERAELFLDIHRVGPINLNESIEILAKHRIKVLLKIYKDNDKFKSLLERYDIHDEAFLKELLNHLCFYLQTETHIVITLSQEKLKASLYAELKNCHELNTNVGRGEKYLERRRHYEEAAYKHLIDESFTEAYQDPTRSRPIFGILCLGRLKADQTYGKDFLVLDEVAKHNATFLGSDLMNQKVVELGIQPCSFFSFMVGLATWPDRILDALISIALTGELPEGFNECLRAPGDKKYVEFPYVEAHLPAISSDVIQYASYRDTTHNDETMLAKGLFGNRPVTVKDATKKHYEKLASEDWANYKKQLRLEKLRIFLRREATKNSEFALTKEQLFTELKNYWAYYFDAEDVNSILKLLAEIKTSNPVFAEAVIEFYHQYRNQSVLVSSSTLTSAPAAELRTEPVSAPATTVSFTATAGSHNMLSDLELQLQALQADILTLESVDEKTKTDAIKVLACLNYIVGHIEDICHIVNDKYNRIHYQTDVDFENQVLRDVDGTSFHIGNYDSGIDAQEKLLGKIAEFCAVAETAKDLSCFVEFIQKLRYDKDRGCLEARIQTGIDFVARRLSIGDKFDLHEAMQRFITLNPDAGAADFSFYQRVYEYFKPYYGLPYMAADFTPEADILTKQIIDNYLQQMFYCNPPPTYEDYKNHCQPRIEPGRGQMMRYCFQNEEKATLFLYYVQTLEELKDTSIRHARIKKEYDFFVVQLTATQTAICESLIATLSVSPAALGIR